MSLPASALNSTRRCRQRSTRSLRGRWPRMPARYGSARSLRRSAALNQALDESTVHQPSRRRRRRTRAAGPSVKTLLATCALAVLAAAWFASGLLQRAARAASRAVVWYDRGTSAIREGVLRRARRRAGDRDRQRLPRWRERDGRKPFAEMGLTDRARENLLQAWRCSGSVEAVGRRIRYVDAVAATSRPQLQDSCRQVHADLGLGWRLRSPRPTSISAAPRRRTRITSRHQSYVKATQLDPQAAAAFLRGASSMAVASRCQGQRHSRRRRTSIGRCRTGRPGRGVLPEGAAGQTQATAERRRNWSNR